VCPGWPLMAIRSPRLSCREAIRQAQARFGLLARFLVANITRRLPFADASFDAVMSNVAVHMFAELLTV
jgi:ubiquinone/menaquinone biosynthesis C-methylase UbiE